MENKTIIRLGKYVFGGSLIMAALLIIIAVVPNWAEGTNTLIGKLFNSCGNYIKAYPVVLFLFVSVLLFLLIGFIAGFFSKSEKTEMEKPRKEKSFFSFYLCSFTLSSLLVFVLSTAFFNPFTSYFYDNYSFVGLISVIYTGTVVMSLLQATLGLSAASLWKTNVAVSIMLLFLQLACLSTTIIPGIIVSVDARTSVCDDDDTKDAPAVAAEEPGWEDTFPITQPVPEDEPHEEDRTYDEGSFCNGLWNETGNCSSNIEFAILYAYSYFKNTLPNYSGHVWTNDMKYPGDDDYNYLWKDETGGYEGYKNFYKLVEFVKNNPHYFAKFFETYENLFFQLISSEMYWGTDAPELVNSLIIAYEDLYRNGTEDGRVKSLEIYEEMIQEYSWGHYLNFIVKRSDGTSLDHFRYNNEDRDLSESQVVWTYSFWARRENEGNAQTTYNILKRMVDHYGEK